MRTPRLLRLLFLPLLLLCQGMALGAYVDNVQLTPAAAPVGTAATVRVTVRIADPTVVPNSLNLQRVDPQGRAVLVGDLRDDGLAGDEAVNDGTYSLQFTVLEERPGPLTYRVSAGVRGKLLRVFSTPATFNVTGAFGTGVSITQPANLVFVNQSPVIVAGTTGDPNATVTVNSIQATKNANAFQTTVPLQEGNNTITAVATNSNGTDSTTSIQVTLDTTPPRVTVDSPPNGLRTTEPGITVSGIVNDIVVGTVNSQQARVTVNGAAAAVVNRTYAAAVPLQLGQNSFQVIGRDQTGNSATTSVTVTRQAVTEPYIRLVSGNNQSAAIGAALPAPLIVQVLNGTTPVPNATVIFKVTESDGFLQPGTGKPQLINVTTNAQGQAQASWTVGNRAGADNNTVEAYAGGYQGTAVFTASATAAAPAQIVVGTGNNQFGAVSKPLPLPLVAIVTDSGFDRLGGVPVTFTVKQGGGSFNGAATYKANSDSDGRVLALLTLGSEPGQDNNVVEASFPGLATLAAAFTASGRVPGDPAQTSITGVVLETATTPSPTSRCACSSPIRGPATTSMCRSATRW